MNTKRNFLIEKINYDSTLDSTLDSTPDSTSNNNDNRSILFLKLAKKYGIKIVYDYTMYMFNHNVDLWCLWFKRLGINTDIVSFGDVKNDDPCMLIAHYYISCPNKCCLVIQTENFVTITHNKCGYTNINTTAALKTMNEAYVVWDYSSANIAILREKYTIKNIFRVPVMFSDNSTLFKDINLNDPQYYINEDWLQIDTSRPIDVIISAHTPRRYKIACDLADKKLKWQSINRSEIPTIILKCKVFLNLHAYDEISALELHRLLDIRNVPIVIVSEASADIDSQEQLNGIPFVKYDELVDICYRLCTDKDLWMKYLDKQMNMWKNINVIEALEQCLPLVEDALVL